MAEIIDRQWFHDNAIVVCFSPNEEPDSSIMAIGLKRDIDFWNSPNGQKHLQSRYIPRVYSIEKYVDAFLQHHGMSE